MTDPTDPTGLSPEDEAEVRRLLAEAGGPVATPPEVVASLDAALAGLVAERAGSAPDSKDSEPVDHTVVHLDSRRRRWPKVLLAAAAVVLGGYALGSTVLPLQGSDDADSATAGAAADSE